MRLISLNTWGGRLRAPLMDFVASASGATDIFCFQELYFTKARFMRLFGVEAHLADELKTALRGFRMISRLADEGAWVKGVAPRDVRMGQAIFVKSPARIIESGGFHTYRQDAETLKENAELVTGNFCYAKIRSGPDEYLVGNIHGLWIPGTKADTPKRREQSEALENFLRRYPGKIVLCGDFNLQPETVSIGQIGSELRNLVEEFGIRTTRNRYYADMEKYKDYIADYMFVSPGVQVRRFEVLPDEVSDHQPLCLEFS